MVSGRMAIAAFELETGQRFVFVITEPFTNDAGTTIRVATWRTDCGKCGRPFNQHVLPRRQAVYLAAFVQNCASCRKPRRPANSHVAAERLADIPPPVSLPVHHVPPPHIQQQRKPRHTSPADPAKPSTPGLMSDR